MTDDEGSYPTIYLHIGTPKSGTTYLQSRMEANRARAMEQGLLWPGPRWGVQVEAVRELRDLPSGSQLDPAGKWLKLVETVRSWSGPRALISMEWLAGCTPAQVRTAMKSLQPARVEVVCTTRDLLRMFVAQWQEMAKNCRPWSWSQFVEEVIGEQPGPASDRFWRQQDVPAILQMWARHNPWERFHLITLPPQGSDPEILWQRFCSVIEIDGSSFEQPERNNEAIGVVSAVLMHRVGLVARDHDVSWLDCQRLYHRGVADEILAPRRGLEAPIAVRPEVDAWLRARSQQQVEDIAKLDVHVVGDLQELLPGPPLEGRDPDDVTDSEMLSTAVEAIVQLAISRDETMRKLREENRALRERLRRPRAGGAVEPEPEVPLVRPDPRPTTPRQRPIIWRAAARLARVLRRSRVGGRRK